MKIQNTDFIGLEKKLGYTQEDIQHNRDVELVRSVMNSPVISSYMKEISLSVRDVITLDDSNKAALQDNRFELYDELSGVSEDMGLHEILKKHRVFSQRMREVSEKVEKVISFIESANIKTGTSDSEDLIPGKDSFKIDHIS